MAATLGKELDDLGVRGGREIYFLPNPLLYSWNVLSVPNSFKIISYAELVITWEHSYARMLSGENGILKAQKEGWDAYTQIVKVVASVCWDCGNFVFFFLHF